MSFRIGFRHRGPRADGFVHTWTFSWNRLYDLIFLDSAFQSNVACRVAKAAFGGGLGVSVFCDLFRAGRVVFDCAIER